ncbi:MAG: hypothetical protein KF774_17100 [Planctomyces sp.]|nr:hypothetical protein [Planctomyces sp.]
MSVAVAIQCFKPLDGASQFFAADAAIAIPIQDEDDGGPEGKGRSRRVRLSRLRPRCERTLGTAIRAGAEATFRRPLPVWSGTAATAPADGAFRRASIVSAALRRLASLRFRGATEFGQQPLEQLADLIPAELRLGLTIGPRSIVATAKASRARTSGVLAAHHILRIPRGARDRLRIVGACACVRRRHRRGAGRDPRPLRHNSPESEC